MNKKIVFFSDLDRTLIYSSSFLKDDISTICIDKKDDKEMSHLSKESYLLLEKINKENAFIPVTSRSKELFTRINFIKRMKPQFAICSNGGLIFIDGKEELEWSKKVNKLISQTKISLTEAKSYIESEIGTLFKRVKIYDNMYLTFQLKELKLDTVKINEVSSYLEQKGFTIQKAGRKMYCIPKGITKVSAMKYLKDNYFKNSKIYSAGDSIMDKELIQISDVGLIPKHGELIKEIESFKKPLIRVTQEEGILAGEEILEIVWKSIKE